MLTLDQTAGQRPAHPGRGERPVAELIDAAVTDPAATAFQDVTGVAVGAARLGEEGWSRWVDWSSS